MFGYVQVRKPELKIKDYAAYRAFYCGLCERLRLKYGVAGRIMLTYDLTFLAVLLSSVYDVKCRREKKRCVVHPAKKHAVLYSEATDYCADMNILLGYYRLLDKERDEGGVMARAGVLAYKNKARKISAAYERQSTAIRRSLSRLSKIERQKEGGVMKAADCFGSMLAEIFVYKEDAFRTYLGDLGYHLGRYIYIMDAYDDLDKDVKNGSFNPLISLREDEDFEEKTGEMLLDEMAKAGDAFERLPCLEYVDILRNILYVGVWNRYDEIKRNKREGLNNERSVRGAWRFPRCH